VRASTAAFAAALTTMGPAVALAADAEPATEAPATPSVRAELTGRLSVGTQLARAARAIDRHRGLVRRHVKLQRELATLEGKGWGKRPVEVTVDDFGGIEPRLLLFATFVVRGLAEDASTTAAAAGTATVAGS